MPSRPAPRLIPITPGPIRNRPVPTHHKDPLKFWDDYYKEHDAAYFKKEGKNPAVDLLETVSYLGRANKFDQVEAAISGYLRHFGTSAEPWMYESLAVAMELRKRDPQTVKTALGFAGFLAKQSRSLDQMTTVADLLFLRGIYEPWEVSVGKKKELVGVGPLLDEASEVAPHLAIPPMMSVNLAQKTNDPKRMADSIEKLLSLGWPDYDDAIRMQARREAEKLAKTLREEERASEADTLLAQLTESEGRDLYIRLSWTGDADLDLIVTESLGAIVGHHMRRSVFGGSLVKEGRGKHREEIYVCPRAFDGIYTIQVVPIYNDPDAAINEATLEVITHDGLPEEHKETHTIRLSKPEPVKVTLSGGRRKVVLPFVAPTPQPTLASPPPKPDAGKTKGIPKTASAPRPTRPNNAADLLGTPPQSSGGAAIDPGSPRSKPRKP